jgi:hypothetical protein
MRFRTRLIVVGSFASLVLAIGTGASSADIQAITINPIAPLSTDHRQVTVSGTITCLQDDSVNLFSNFIETVGRNQLFTHNANLYTITCTGDVQPWSIVLTDFGAVPLRPGFVNVGAFGFDSDGSPQFTARNEVLLVP